MNPKRKLWVIALALLTLGVGQFGVFPAFAQADTTESADECILYGRGDDQVQEADDANEDEVGDVDAQDVEDGETGEANDAQGETDANETDNAADDENQDASYTGSIAVDEAAFADMSSADRCAALGALATITAEEAQAVGEAEGTAATVEIEIENGYLVYGVALEDGRDVKVDAGNGTVLNIDAVEDTESGTDLTDEADEVAPAGTGITAAEAQAIAEAETGSTTLAVEYDVEGGIELFEVEMTDGTDVRVAASDGAILGIEQRDAS